MVWIASSSAACSLGSNKSRVATTTGGSLRIRGSPSTISVSLPKARTLSFERALAMFFSTRFICFVDAAVANCSTSSSTEMREDQRSRSAIGARRRDVDRGPLGGGESAVASRDREAGDEALDVPLERSRQGLVEVVDV